ncbi:MAG: hypothetical protein RIB60_01845 [Phycisphaerales bacterium]
MPDGYDTHAEYMSWAAPEAAHRRLSIGSAFEEAFANWASEQPRKVIHFGQLSASELAGAILSQPSILKGLTASCNVAARAIERDLSIKNVDTYQPKLSEAEALQLAEYLMQFLPKELSIDALLELDRHFFVDKTIRMTKGQWEKLIAQSLSDITGHAFRKRLFTLHGEKFELDAATPEKGDIAVGIDVKRIEARRDIHKRADEVVNKAVKFKTAYPHAVFIAVVYYPFVDEHARLQDRLASKQIDAVAFASTAAEQTSRALRAAAEQAKII